MNRIKKYAQILLYGLFLGTLPFLDIILGSDHLASLINNLDSACLLVAATVLSVAFVLPLFFRHHYLGIIAPLIFAALVYVNWLLMVASIHQGVPSLYIRRIYSILMTLDSLGLQMVSGYMIYKSLKAKTVPEVFLSVFYGLFALANVLWFSADYLSRYGIAGFFFLPRINFDLMVMFRLDVFVSAVALFTAFNMTLFSPKQRIYRISTDEKVGAIIIWLFIGLFGAERLFSKTRYFIMNFQLVTAVMVIYKMVVTWGHQNGSALNEVFIMSMNILLLIKIAVSIISLADIIFIPRHDEEDLGNI